MESNVADDRRLRARIVFHAVTPENEPLGDSVEFRVDAEGFWAPHPAGSGGEGPAPLGLGSVAALLSKSFDRDELSSILSHFCALQRDI